MKSIYLSVILILTSTVLTAQIREVPILGNPVLEKIYAKNQAAQEMMDLPETAQLRADCPEIDRNIYYLFPGDTFFIELDTFNLQKYRLINPAAGIGTVEERDESITFTAGATTGAAKEDLIIERIVAGTDTSEQVFTFIVKRRNLSTVMLEEVLAPEEGLLLCAEPLDGLPGAVMCNNIFTCSESYGGNGLQKFRFNSGNLDENCFRYFSTRFPGRDTICVVLCDEFTVCDTFKQPFLIVGDTLDLPFFEDFSNANSPYPNKDLWLEDLVFISETMPFQPPSVGVATFDFIDASGSPYVKTVGTRDRLTSKAFDLSKEDVDSKVVLSFYYQKKGRGFLPLADDSLMVEFWTDTSGWKTVAAIPGSQRFIALDSFPKFEFMGISLDREEYFHDGFQFRFKNFSNNGGSFGSWNLDYIRFDKNSDANTQTFKDITVSEIKSSVLENYQDMPLHQFTGFEDQELSKDFEVTFFNHFAEPTEIKETDIFFEELVTGTEFMNFALQTPVNVPSLEYLTIFESVPTTQFDGLKTGLNLFADTNDELEAAFKFRLINGEQVGFADINDYARVSGKLDDYFAYDDGTAERGLEINGQNTAIALEFEANVPDMLSAIKIHFPETGSNFESQEFSLLIWTGTESLNGVDPVRELRLRRPKNSGFLQSFTTYQIVNSDNEFEPIPIPAGKFFIGIKNTGTVTPAFAIGYDRNNPAVVDKLWTSSGSGTLWKPYKSVIPFSGAPMIRPVMGDSLIANVEPVKQIVSSAVRLFPNPASDVLNFKTEFGQEEDYNLKIFNALGQIIYEDLLVSQLNISDFTSGIYFAKITNLQSGYVQNLQFFKEK